MKCIWADPCSQVKQDFPSYSSSKTSLKKRRDPFLQLMRMKVWFLARSWLYPTEPLPLRNLYTISDKERFKIGILLRARIFKWHLRLNNFKETFIKMMLLFSKISLTKWNHRSKQLFHKKNNTRTNNRQASTPALTSNQAQLLKSVDFQPRKEKRKPVGNSMQSGAFKTKSRSKCNST